MDNSIIDQGLELMLFGMGTVVLFLTLLVVITTGMSAFVERFFPEPLVVPPAAKRVAPTAGNDAQLVAAIGVAIHRHRQLDTQ